MRVGIYAGGLDLENICWHSAVCLDAHVFVDYRWRDALTVGLRSTNTAAENTQPLVLSLSPCTGGKTERMLAYFSEVWV